MAKMTVEELAKQIMKEMAADGEPVTEAEAKEMAEMELKAKGIKNYTQATVEKKPRAKKEVKLDDVKVHLIKMLASFLEGMAATDNVKNAEIVNPQKEISFQIGNDFYSVTLTKHRPIKKQGGTLNRWGSDKVQFLVKRFYDIMFVPPFLKATSVKAGCFYL